MSIIVGRFVRLLRGFVGGWDYTKWDPPYPGDGI